MRFRGVLSRGMKSELISLTVWNRSSTQPSTYWVQTMGSRRLGRLRRPETVPLLVFSPQREEPSKGEAKA